MFSTFVGLGRFISCQRPDFATQLSYDFLLPEVQCNVSPQLKCYTT